LPWPAKWRAARVARRSGSNISRSQAGPAKRPMIWSTTESRIRGWRIWREFARASMPEAASLSRLTLWRAFVSPWAYLPLSGEGAARFGGRWNPVGAPTIYAARELSTAWAEYNQGFVQHPALTVQLQLSNARLLDLTQPEILDRLGI